MAVVTTNLGPVTAYADAVAGGYKGTREEWQALMASYASVAQEAAQSAQTATDAASSASQSASDAEAAADSINAPDKTLTIEGRAADAKETGTRFQNFASALNTTNEDVAALGAQADRKFNGIESSLADISTGVQEMSGEIADVKRDLNDITTKQTILKKVNKSSAEMTAYGTRGYIDSANGQLYPNNNYQVYSYTVTKTGDVWFDSNEDWCQFAVYRGTLLNQASLVGSVIRNNAAGFPLSDNKYTSLQIGDIVAICIQVGRSHDFSYNYPVWGSVVINDATISDIGERLNIPTIQSAVEDISALNYTAVDKASSVLSVYGTNGYIASDGTFTSNSSYKVYYFEAPEDGYVWFDSDAIFTIFAVYNGTLFDSSALVGRYAHNSVDSHLPLVDTKCAIQKGQVLAISIGSGNYDNFGFHYPNKYAVAGIDKKPMLKYRSVTGTSDPQIFYSDKATSVLSLYIPSTDGYIQYNIGKSSHLTQAEGGYDVTRMCVLYATDDNFTKKFDITRPGEWEMAVKISGQADFIGGFEHGDEWETSAQYFVDGELVDITNYTSLTEFNEVRVKSASNMYLPADHETLVGIHGKEWVFTKESAVLYQSIQWQFNTDTQMTASYLTMFPAIRGNDTISEDQITSRFFDDVNFTTRDCSVYGFDGDMSPATRKVTLYSPESGFFGEVEVLEYPSYPDSAYVYLANGENKANKIYFGVCGYSSTKGIVIPNQIWKSKSIYRMTLTEGTN